MSLELKKKKLELARVEIARQELEFRIEERLDEIRRLEEHVKVQMQAEERLKTELENLSK